MKKLSKKSPAVQEAIALLKDKSVSDEQKISYLQDWEWYPEQIVELALMAADSK